MVVSLRAPVRGQEVSTLLEILDRRPRSLDSDGAMTVSTLLEILAPAPLGATWFLVVVSTLLEILGSRRRTACRSP